MQLRGNIYMWIAGLLIAGNMVCMGQNESGDTDYQYALIEAVKQKNLGNPSEAAKLYSLVIKEKPDCDVAYYELGGIYLMSDKIDLAVQALEKAFTLDPENEWYTLAYLNALGAGKHFETMEGILKEKIKSDPEETEWEYQLAATYFSQEKPKKAIKTLENIEKENGFSEKVTLLKASVYESEKEYELALLELEKVMVLFPEAVQFRVVAAELCLKSGQEEQAANYYLDILETDSTNIFALTNLTDYYRKKQDFSSSFIYLARSFRNERIDARRKMAILSYYLSEEKYVNNYPGDLEKLLDVLIQVHPGEYEILLMASDFHIQIKSYDKAYWNLKNYLDARGGNFPIYMQAILLANAGSLNHELVTITGQALKYYPDSADVRFFRGLGFYGLEEYQEMIDNFDSVNYENYTTKEYIYQSNMLYAEACYRLKDFGKSDSIFESLIAENPENYMVLNNFSYYLAERSVKLDKAENWSRKAIENNPDNSTFLDTYAWVMYKRGAFGEAEKYIMKALEKGGDNDPEVNEHAGDIQVALKSPDIAKSYYLKAIILGGNKAILDGKINALYQENNE